MGEVATKLKHWCNVRPVTEISWYAVVLLVFLRLILTYILILSLN